MSIAIAPPSGDSPSYHRDEWPHWTDEDGDCQDTRQEVLIAESLSAVEYTDSDECRVASGTWTGPYTGEEFADPANLDIDHLVPLANAHVSGGWEWSESRKSQYANDISFEGHLVAVHGQSNRTKGASGPEEWRPPESSYWCQYAIDWITIKNSWGLTSTEAELAALSEMLDTCEPRRVLVGIEPEGRQAAATYPPSPSATAAALLEGAYASCEEAEAAGEERERGSAGEGWGFPQSMVPSARDRDDDGVVCEEAVRGATPTPVPVATATQEAAPTATATVTDGVYASCEEAEAAGEEREQESAGEGWGFPQSMVPSARDGDDDGVVCEETVRSATPTPVPVATATQEASPTATVTVTDGVYASCEEAEAAGEERVQGSSGSGRGFPQSMVPSARDGDDDGVVCEETVRSATPTPVPVATATQEASPTATVTVTDGVYASCEEAEAAGEERVQGSSGSGRGFPQSMVPSARDGDDDGVVCEETVRSATPTPVPVATATQEASPTATVTVTDGVYATCEEAEAAGEERVQGSNGNGRGFPQSMVPSARDGDDDGVVCEETARSATPTPRPVATATTGTDGVYASCEEAEAAGEERVQGSSGTGRGFPQSMVPSAR
ncbi:MAG: HNH endonuclease family protein, partial [Chloroflexota bacterium]|nr:HNH endonuclease family protein [Chloroflexota bacterium]